METPETTQPERKPILAISTLAPVRPLAHVDDVPHEFRLKQDFGSIEDAEFARDTRRYDELYNAEKRSKAENAEMDRLLDRSFDRVMVDPQALRDQLGPEQQDEDGHTIGLTGAIKREFVLTFTNAPQLMRLLALQEEAEQETASKKARENGSTSES